MTTHETIRIPTIVAAAAAALVCASASAYAEGNVVKVDDAQIYVDLGAEDGVGEGSKLVLYHLVVVKDPVSGRTLRDRFALGMLTVIKAGDHMALATAPEQIKHRVKIGDQVELASAPRTFSDPWQETIDQRTLERAALSSKQARKTGRTAGESSAQARARAEREVADTNAARTAWQTTLGKSPADRIAVWAAFMAAHPDSAYRDEIAIEIRSLEQQMREEQRIAEQMKDPDSHRAAMRRLRFAAVEPGADVEQPLLVLEPGEVYEGTAVQLAFTVLDSKLVDRAWLYYRRRGEGSFRRIQLEHDGDAYLRGTIPADAARPPGIEYFVESAAKSSDAAPQPVLGSQESPQRIAVQAAVEDEPADIDDRSRVTFFLDYVDFDGGFGGGFDQYVHAEIDFMYRFRKPIYAMRVGFGTLGGIGGPKDIIDSSPGGDCRDPDGNFRCRRVSFSYAYTELEYRFSKNLAVMLRPQFGSGTSDGRGGADSDRCTTADTDDCELFSSLGLRARVRIGDEQSTNLTLGAGVTQNVGMLFEAAYTWSVIPHFPVKLAAQVTDQPVPEDIGVRFIADVGWRALDWVYPSIRLAYQARDADHAGISGGVAANFDW